MRIGRRVGKSAPGNALRGFPNANPMTSAAWTNCATLISSRRNDRRL